MLGAGVLTAGCGGGGGSDPDLSVTFDGATCNYEGPVRMPAGDVTVSFTNDSVDAAGLAFLSIPPGMTVEPGVGTDFAITAPEPGGGVEVVGVLQLDAGTEATELAALAAGTHTIDCFTFGPAGPDHGWRAAIVEVERRRP